MRLLVASVLLLWAGPAVCMAQEPQSVVDRGYAEGTAVVLRLLTRIAPDTYVVSYETTASVRAAATGCAFTGPDLDGDGQPDVRLEVSSGPVSSTWAFKWTGDTLAPRVSPSPR